MSSVKNDIIWILRNICYPKKIVRVYYKINSTTGGYIEKQHIITSLSNAEDFIKYKDAYLGNFIKMEVIEVQSNAVDTYRIKTYQKLEVESR